jgi:carbamate kinase
VVALGGNSIKQASQDGTTEEQIRNCEIACDHLVEIVRMLGSKGRLLITHGNGPQAGNIMIQQEMAKGIVPAHTMDVVGAMTQGQIGYMLQQTLTNRLKDAGISTPVCSILNRVLVNENDRQFCDEEASKPVGDFLTKAEAERMRKSHFDYVFKRVKPGKGKVWRRCVSSPEPLSNVEADVIKQLVRLGVIVIASGGGGIPVIIDNKGHFKGVEAVIDKDLAGEKLAEAVGANIFLILTDVEKVKLNFGKPKETEIDKLTIAEAKKYLADGHFLSGSMKPKIQACIRFLEWGGEKAIITSLDKAIEALAGKTGTLIC